LTGLEKCGKNTSEDEYMTLKEKKYFGKIHRCRFIIKRLDGLGINRKYLGYYYVVDILDIMINDDMEIKSFSRQIYPQIASKYGKTECTVERNIRSLIDKTWGINVSNLLGDFSPSEEKPTCQKFLYAVKNYIIQDIA